MGVRLWFDRLTTPRKIEGRLTRSLSLPFDLLRALGFTEGSNHHAATTEYHLPAGRSALEGLTTVFGMGPGVYLPCGVWFLGGLPRTPRFWRKFIWSPEIPWVRAYRPLAWDFCGDGGFIVIVQFHPSRNIGGTFNLHIAESYEPTEWPEGELRDEMSLTALEVEGDCNPSKTRPRVRFEVQPELNGSQRSVVFFAEQQRAEVWIPGTESWL